MPNLIADLKNFIKSKPCPIVVLLGPTASGKTDLSIKIAQEINGEIISTDSRQVYKGMEIGTAAITEEERKSVPHHLLSIVNPDEEFTLAHFLERALKIIEEIYARGHVPMLVGGTGLYISSIIDNYDLKKIPPNQELRDSLEKLAKDKGPEALHEKLHKIDPEIAASIHPNNLRFVIRAIEKLESTKLPNTPQLDKLIVQATPVDPYLIGIDWPREELYNRIDLRVDKQIEQGLIEEVKELLKKGYDQNLPSMSSLGVKEIIPFIKGKMPLADCLDILKRGTRRYAKRQMTWFRRYDNVHWLTPKECQKILQNS